MATAPLTQELIVAGPGPGPSSGVAGAAAVNERTGANRTGFGGMNLVRLETGVLVTKDEADRRIMPPPPKKVVLEEDDYVDTLGKIIQRDFFPDLPKLRLQHEYIQAMERNDLEKMREIKITMARRTDLRGPGTGGAGGRATPGGPGTPSDWGRATPSRGARHSTPSEIESVSASGERTADTSGAASSAAAAAAAQKMSLTQFQATHTSEDNESFKEVLQADNDHKRHVHRHFYHDIPDPNIPLLVDGTSRLMLPPPVETWRFTAVNALMYNKDGVAFSADEEKLRNKGPPKEIKHANTRLEGEAPSQRTTTQPGAAPARPGEYGMVGQHAAATLGAQAAANARYDAQGHLVSGVPASPRVGGYGFVTTPSPAPGVAESPFMTWGDIDGTPLLLDGNATPMTTSGVPIFAIPEEDERHKTGMELAEKVSRKMAHQRNTSHRFTPTRTAAPGTPNRLAALSPAAQSFAKRSLPTTSTMANSLRATYASPRHGGARTPGGSVAHTPGGGTQLRTPGAGGAHTPGASPFVRPRMDSMARGAGVVPQGVPAPVSAGPSLTDDLMNI